MGVWKLASPKSTEPLSHFESMGWNQEVLIFQFKGSEAGKANIPVQRPTGRILSYLGKGQPFVLFKLTADWKMPIHIMEGDLLYKVF